MNNKIRMVYEKHDIDMEQIRTSVINRINEHTRSPRHFRKPMLAACIAILVMLSCISGYAIAAEAKEYAEAVEFFDEYSLSTEGLTRTQIKAVYEDISMKTYSYEKTIEILNKFSIEMYSTALESVDRDKLEALWNSRYNMMIDDSEEERSDIWYDLSYSEPKSIIKYDGDTELWRYTIPYYMLLSMSDNCLVTNDGILAYDSKDNMGANSGYACAFMLDNSGNLLWEYIDTTVNTRFETVAISEDEFAFFGYGYSANDKMLLFTVLDHDGQLIKRHVMQTEQHSSCDTAVKVNDFYLVKRFSLTTDTWGTDSFEPELISISSDGELMNNLSYTDYDTGAAYQIQDIIYYEGKVYLSALMPNNPDESFEEQFNELGHEYLDEYFKAKSDGSTKKSPEMSDEYNNRLRTLFSDAYTAVLLICDENAEIMKAYSVDNSRAVTLSATDGHLAWKVMRIDDVKNAPPEISSKRVDILATEFSFVFDAAGKLIEKHEIGHCSLTA